MAKFIILPVIFLIAGFVPALSAAGEWVDFALWKLEANGLTGSVFASSRPFEREEIAQIIADIREGIKNGRLDPNQLELGLIRKLETEFASPGKVKMRGLLAGEAGYHDEWESPSVSFWCAASLHPTPYLTLYEEINIARKRELVGEAGRTASRRTNPWRWDYTADFKQAYARFHNERFEALLGRKSLFWGPTYSGSLILSDNSPALDMILLKVNFDTVEATAFSAVLDKKWSERGNPPYRFLASRYMSGHRIDWIVNDKIELGICELALYGGEERNMELQYINPLLPYYASQWNEDQDDNVLASADFAIRPVDGLKIYGQFLVDDFQYSGKSPNALGYTAGFYLSDPLRLPGSDLRAEYTHIDARTYTHRIAENQFTHYGWTIGHHLGSDADELLAELSQMINVDARLKLTYTYQRQGSGTRRHQARLQFLWELTRGQHVDVSCGGVSVRNQGNSTLKGEASFAVGFLTGTE